MADINNLGKIIAVTGHYGSGKTNLAVNLAVDFAKEGERVTIIDLDIVNPYFRTADFSELFGSLGDKAGRAAVCEYKPRYSLARF